MAQLAISLSTGDVILIVVFATIPVALITFVLGARNALDQIGKGPLSVEFESDLPSKITDDEAAATPAEREAEIRQLLEAKAYRQRLRGEAPLDVESELTRLLEQRAERRSGVHPQLADEDDLEQTLEQFQTHYHGGTAGSVSGTALEQGDGTDDEEENGETQDPGR